MFPLRPNSDHPHDALRQSPPPSPSASNVACPDTPGSTLSLPVVPLCTPALDVSPQLSAFLCTKCIDHLLTSLMPFPVPRPLYRDDPVGDQVPVLFQLYSSKLATTHSAQMLLLPVPDVTCPDTPRSTVSPHPHAPSPLLHPYDDPDNDAAHTLSFSYLATTTRPLPHPPPPHDDNDTTSRRYPSCHHHHHHHHHRHQDVPRATIVLPPPPPPPPSCHHYHRHDNDNDDDATWRRGAAPCATLVLPPPSCHHHHHHDDNDDDDVPVPPLVPPPPPP
ncbi:hypothetical protein V8E55_007029 [Tylopilus felleus]